MRPLTLIAQRLFQALNHERIAATAVLSADSGAAESRSEHHRCEFRLSATAAVSVQLPAERLASAKRSATSEWRTGSSACASGHRNFWPVSRRNGLPLLQG